MLAHSGGVRAAPPLDWHHDIANGGATALTYPSVLGDVGVRALGHVHAAHGSLPGPDGRDVELQLPAGAHAHHLVQVRLGAPEPLAALPLVLRALALKRERDALAVHERHAKLWDGLAPAIDGGGKEVRVGTAQQVRETRASRQQLRALT